MNFSELKINKTQINKNNSPKKCFKEKDAKTKNYIDKYCGNLFYNFRKKDESLSISLPVNNNSSYGHNPLYCEYTIFNKNSIESLTINTKINWGSLKAIIKYNFIETNYEIILGNGDQNIFKDVEEFNIIFESNIVKNTTPFEIQIINTVTKINKKTLIYIIILSLLGVLVIIIIFIICYRRRKKFIMDNTIKNLNNIYTNNINSTEDESTERMGLMNYLNMLKPIKFKEINKNKKEIKNLKCPIDIENFDLDSEVILTECLHLFHYDCIKVFIEKNKALKELKCPLCKRVLYTTMINDEKCSINSNKNSIRKFE